ncbi:hypothetical protein BHE90_001518 [Fusarium euwallaceae]|uniref:Nephrocystin 3-like N-terminal domain-containing protein n=1 Tax=Fusarium euwallaceae TaxID=1147111 RepID=A0A430M7M2_9HYPO|nr:hypothetical protein BHE90_001518 [Fusarium euwallaceae]
MKFLENDERTKRHLEKWSGDHRLITAGFYFWNSGTELQISIPGLLRSLIYLVLHEHPDLILLLCPERWEELSRFSDAEPRPWTTAELHRVFQRLSGEQFSHLRFFFLIDGLDEFIGDHEELIDLIRDLIDCEHIKVCVASRPWPVFQGAFNKRPNFMLQNLTLKDIEIYVRSKFDDSPWFRPMQYQNSQQAERFLTDIIDRSDGVFL